MLIKKYSIKEIDLISENLYVDCKNAIFGRLLSFIAKLSKNEIVKHVYLYNLENILFKSKEEYLLNKYKEKINKGLGKGPYFPKSKEKFIRYILKSMFPKTKKAKENYKKIITWKSLQSENALTFEKPMKIKYITKYNNLLNKIKHT